jgi:hypothetical protein
MNPDPLHPVQREAVTMMHRLTRIACKRISAHARRTIRKIIELKNP